jgi:hypothetical protein
MTVRSEYLEGKILVSFLRKQGLLFSHLPLNTWTGSFKQLAKNKASGVVKGVPDYVIVLPETVLFIELKKAKGGTVSKEQKIWVSRLTLAGCPARVCRGAEEAIAFVKEFL